MSTKPLLRFGWALLGAAALCATPALCGDAAITWPTKDLARFIFERLDLSSFRNSTGPRRAPGQRFFKDLGIRVTEATESTATSSTDAWTYVLQVLGQRDYNGDGVQDVAICFSDSAGQGSYRTSQPYLVDLIEGRAVALAYEIESEDCPPEPGALR